jgi:hypothetical protein
MYKLLLKNLEIYLIVATLMVVLMTHILMIVPSVHIMDRNEQTIHSTINLVAGMILVGFFVRFVMFYLK